MTDLLEGLEDIRRLTIRPGDTLVFRFKHPLSHELADDIGHYLKEKLGEDVKILILDAGTTLDVVERSND